MKEINFVEWDVPESAVQVFHMDGTELSTTTLAEKRDYDIAVSEVGQQAATPSALPTRYTSSIVPLYGLGRSKSWSADICRHGKRENRPLYGILAGVLNNSSESLLVKGIEPDLSYNDRGPVDVALVPPGKNVHVLFEAVEQGWVVAYDSAGNLRYSTPVPLEPKVSVTIPPGLPRSSVPVPLLDFTKRSDWFGCDKWPFGDFTRSDMTRFGMFVSAAALFTIAVLGGQWLYKRLRPS